MVLRYIQKIKHDMLCVTSVYLRARLHFPCIGQKVNQRSFNSYFHHEVAATEFLVVIRYVHLIFGRGRLLDHRAVSGNSDESSLWSCYQPEV